MCHHFVFYQTVLLENPGPFFHPTAILRSFSSEVYSCQPFAQCGGHGDRLNGIITVFLLAAAWLPLFFWKAKVFKRGKKKEEEATATCWVVFFGDFWDLLGYQKDFVFSFGAFTRHLKQPKETEANKKAKFKPPTKHNWGLFLLHVFHCLILKHNLFC